MFSWSSAHLPLWMVYLITATCCSQLCSAACILASRNTWHPETQRVFGAVPFSVRVVLSERLPGRVAHQVQQQLTKDQIQIAGPCDRVTSKVLFSFLLLILLLREAANSKTFAACFDVSEWASPFSAAEFHTWENNLQSPG